MLSRYDGKTIRLTTNDGEVFTGEAQAFPSGYGLDTFGVEEEGLALNGTHFFLSQIGRIEPATGFAVTDAERERYDALTRELIDRPYRAVDMLPTPVPDDAAGQAFMAERYFRLAPQRSVLRRRQAHILLRLNCYDDMAVTTDGGTNWEKNPDPERFVRTLDELSGGFMRILFPTLNVMVELYDADTQMTVVCPDAAPTETIRQLAAAEGLFLWEEKE
jgi:hypothetical protein